MGLNQAQSRVVRATFAHVSGLLDSVLKVAQGDLTPFDRIRGDVSPAEARRLAALVASIRERMLEALDTLGVSAPRPETSARWSARTAFLFSQISLSELSGDGLRAYGAIDPGDQRLVAAVAEDLRRMVERAQDLLHGPDAAVVEASVDRVPGPIGAALRDLWRFARRHELVEVFAEVSAVAERATAPAADVGVFGRTNAGKSSLINALVGVDVLPVGAVPTTAVPLRIARGPEALRVKRGSGSDEERALEELPRFDRESLEDGGGDIVALEALVPTAPPGIRLIDTPGVGSYATPVAARALEWLPRCDLALLLLPAGSVPEAEDVAVARGLTAAGVDLAVVLSKADLLGNVELDASEQHLRRELEHHLGRSVSTILPVSVSERGAGPGLGRLRAEVLDPLVAERERSSSSRIHRRLLHLAASVESAFHGRAAGAVEAAPQRESVVERARVRVEEALDEFSRSRASAMENAADALVRAWREGGEPPQRADVEARLAAPADATLEAVRHILEDAARATSGSGAQELPAMPPLFAFTLPEASPTLGPGTLGGRVFPRPRAKRRLGPMGGSVAEAYRRYTDRLRSWATAMLAGLEEAGPLASEESTAAEIEALRGAVARLDDRAPADGAPS